MIPLIEEHRSELEALCRKHGVKTLELFGSAADGTFDPARSDLDFLVEFKPNTVAGPFHDYFNLHEGLESLFGRKIDLVCSHTVRNPYLRKEIDRQRKMLYAA